MILYLPEKFDENEWTVIIGVVLNILLFKFLPRRLPKEIISLIVLLSISFPTLLDHSIAAKSINLYNLNDMREYEIFDVILYGVYPAFGYLFVYFLNYWDLKGIWVAFYILIWCIFGYSMDFLLEKLHVFNFTGWKLTYSLPLYLVVLSLTYLFYKLLIYYADKISIERT
ncbi:hypothetical protein OEV98_14740 [Caldibacillus lycopersici]|uniref:Uncharacterized protein n=1 Tax=Perspicuibacillus lycopersici TaxID=1325689 RepID=A0AAE3IUF3_9BACI|nr:hypothetical protein [Perspicuibacillus lycopersici]MCU9614798.1 hypothetical protein [Perspicuibacillus lycopersici]